MLDASLPVKGRRFSQDSWGLHETSSSYSSASSPPQGLGIQFKVEWIKWNQLSLVIKVAHVSGSQDHRSEIKRRWPVLCSCCPASVREYRTTTWLDPGNRRSAWCFSGVIKHGMENPLGMEVFIGKSLITGSLSIAMFDYRKVFCWAWGFAGCMIFNRGWLYHSPMQR